MEEKKKNNTSLVVLACLIVAVVVCCGLLVVKQLTKNTTPKNMFINGIENIFNKEMNIKEFDTAKAEVSMSLNLKTDLVEKDVLDLINKINLKLNANVDKKNKVLLLGVDTKYDKDEVLDAKMYFDDNSLYVYLNDIFDKWIKIDTSEISTENFNTSFTLNQEEVDYEQVEVLITEMKDALLGSLKDEYFTKDKEDDFNKVTLTITKDNALDIINDFVKNLKNSTKFKDAGKKVVGVDMDTILTQVEESMKQVSKNDLASLEDVKVSVYLKDNEIKKISVDTTVEGTPLKLEVEIDDNNFSIAMYMMGIKFIDFSVKSEKSGDTTKTVIKFSITGTLEFTANIDSTIKYDEKIDKVDVSKSVKAEEMTEAEINTISEKLMSSKGLVKLLEAVEKVMPQSDYNYNYNYDLDYQY